jgi:hypothetical protein
MPSRRVNPNRVKLHRSYSVSELAVCLDVHKNTVRHWQAHGLEPVEPRKPYLFHGATTREFLAKRNASRKRPCSPGMFYCLRCRQPRQPALGMVDYLPLRADSGNLRAICACCEAIMHRRVRKPDIARIMPNCAVQFAEGQPRLSGQPRPSLNCDSERLG